VPLSDAGRAAIARSNATRKITKAQRLARRNTMRAINADKTHAERAAQGRKLQELRAECPHCDRVGNLGNIRKHVRRLHGDRRPVAMVWCSICGRVRDGKHDERAHDQAEQLKTHLPFRCERCQRAELISKHAARSGQRFCETCFIERRRERGRAAHAARQAAKPEPAELPPLPTTPCPPARAALEALSCPWPGCDYRATSVANRNRHVLEECEHRPGPKKCAACGDRFEFPAEAMAHQCGSRKMLVSA